MKNKPYICKIYSRKRMNLFKKHNINGSTLKIFIVLGVFLILCLIIYNALNAINPIFQTLCEDNAKAIATKITNEESTKIMTLHSYDELFKIEKDSRRENSTY